MSECSVKNVSCEVNSSNDDNEGDSDNSWVKDGRPRGAEVNINEDYNGINSKPKPGRPCQATRMTGDYCGRYGSHQIGRGAFMAVSLFRCQIPTYSPRACVPPGRAPCNFTSGCEVSKAVQRIQYRTMVGGRTGGEGSMNGWSKHYGHIQVLHSM